MMSATELEKALGGDYFPTTPSRLTRKSPKRLLPSHISESPAMTRLKRSRLAAFNNSAMNDSTVQSPRAKWPTADYYRNFHGQEELTEQDVEKEKREMIEEIRRLSIDKNVDFANLSFRGLDDPDKNVFTVENRLTSEVFPVEKSPRIIRALKNKQQRSHQHIELRDPSNMSPSTSRSGLVRTWLAFEKL